MSETAAGPRCTCNDSSTAVPWCLIHPGTPPVAASEEPEVCGEVVGKTTQIKHIFCTKEKGHDGSCAALTPTEPVAVSEPVAIYQWREPAVSASWLDSSCDDPREHLERLAKLPGVETRIVYTRPVEEAREAHRSGYQSAVEMFAENPVDSIHAAYEEVLAWEALTYQSEGVESGDWRLAGGAAPRSPDDISPEEAIRRLRGHAPTEPTEEP